jgi:hypothetical protein
MHWLSYYRTWLRILVCTTYHGSTALPRTVLTYPTVTVSLTLWSMSRSTDKHIHFWHVVQVVLSSGNLWFQISIHAGMCLDQGGATSNGPLETSAWGATSGIQQCVRMVGTKIHDGSSQKLTFVGAVSLLQSCKGGAKQSPESMVTLWDMGSPFY